MSRIADEVGFVHLRVHSAYSLLEGALQIKKLASLARADRMPALGLADTGNLFGALEFAEKMVESGIQPIVGCQVAVDFGDTPEPDRPGAAATEAPLRHRPHRRQRGRLLEPRAPGLLVLHGDIDPATAPHLAVAALEGASDGLIVLTGGPGGPIDRAIASGRANSPQPGSTGSRRSSPTGSMSSCSATCICERGDGRAAPSRSRLCAAACRWSPPTRSFFPARDDYEAHDALICIAEGAVIADDNRRRLTPGALFQDRARR